MSRSAGVSPAGRQRSGTKPASKGSVKTFAAITALAIAGVALYQHTKPKTYPAGIVIDADPIQSAIQEPMPPMQKAGFDIKPLAHFEITARVLHKRRYRFDSVANLAPLDLAVGWACMSDQQVLDQLGISQSNRFFFWEYQHAPPIPTDQIISHATNMHLIPPDDGMFRKINSADAGDLIHLRGLLIEASQPGMPPWRSSLSRNDTGKGACEIVWVEAFDKF